MVHLALDVSRATGLKQILFFGGVISSTLIKEMLSRALEARNLKTLFAHSGYSADNAAGVALFAKRKYFLEG